MTESPPESSLVAAPPSGAAGAESTRVSDRALFLRRGEAPALPPLPPPPAAPAAPAEEGPAAPPATRRIMARAHDFTARSGNGRVINLRDTYTPPPEPWQRPRSDDDVSPDAAGAPPSSLVALPGGGVPPTLAGTALAPLPLQPLPKVVHTLHATPVIHPPSVGVARALPTPRGDAPAPASPPTVDPEVAPPPPPRMTALFQQIRREVDAALLAAQPESVNFENEVVCRLCESFRAEHACLWLVPPDLGTIWDWGRKTIVAEAAAQTHRQPAFTHTAPPREWAIQYLDPILRAAGAIVFSVPAPAVSQDGPPATTHYLAICLAGHPGFRWALMFERRASAWTETEAALLEDLALTLALAFEGRLLAKQSIERGTYLNNLLNSSDIAVMVIEQTTPGRPVITMVNQRFRELFHIPQAKIAGSSHRELMELIRPVLSDWDIQGRILDGLLADPAAERMDEMVIGHPAGGAQRILQRYSAPARDVSGHIFGRMFFFRDVTYDKEMERQILHSQKMDSIGTLAGGVAHDFNNLLTTILGYTELLKRASGEDEGTFQKLLQIERSASRAAELTGQLLAFSRRSPTVLKLFDLAKLLEETHAMLRSTVPATIELKLEPQPDMPPIEADETQIQQVVINLVINARDALAARKNGSVIISTRRGFDAQALPQNAGRTFVVLEVEDNGIGIPKESLHRIFEPFFTTKEVGKGTGLGLAMVYGIVKKHNGFIEVNSAENIGTKFSVYLPAGAAPTPEPPPPAAPTPSEKRAVTVMVVDDEPDLREFCAAALSDVAETVLTAADGLEALERFQKVDFKVDLVVLDLTMPKMAGPECAYLMRTMKPDIKILISSGYGPDVTADPQLQGQVAGFLPKPYDLNQLIAKVSEILDRK